MGSWDKPCTRTIKYQSCELQLSRDGQRPTQPSRPTTEEVWEAAGGGLHGEAPAGIPAAVLGSRVGNTSVPPAQPTSPAHGGAERSAEGVWLGFSPLLWGCAPGGGSSRPAEGNRCRQCGVGDGFAPCKPQDQLGSS